MTSDQAAGLAVQITNRTGLPTRTIQLYRGDDGWVVAVDDGLDPTSETPVLIGQHAGEAGFGLEIYLREDLPSAETVDGVCAALTAWTAGKAVLR